jgi:hypothetical protein
MIRGRRKLHEFMKREALGLSQTFFPYFLFTLADG